MKHVKWGTRRSRRSRVWTSIWIFGFIGGLLLVILARGTMQVLDRNPARNEVQRQPFSLVESSPVQEKTVKAEQEAVSPNRKLSRKKPLWAFTRKW